MRLARYERAGEARLAMVAGIQIQAYVPDWMEFSI